MYKFMAIPLVQTHFANYTMVTIKIKAVFYIFESIGYKNVKCPSRNTTNVAKKPELFERRFARAYNIINWTFHNRLGLLDYGLIINCFQHIVKYQASNKTNVYKNYCACYKNFIEDNNERSLKQTKRRLII